MEGKITTAPTLAVDSVEWPLEFHARFNSGQSLFKSVYSPHNNSVREVISLLPCWWRKQRPEWLKILPEVKTKDENSRKPTVMLHLDTMKRHHQKLALTLACHLAGQAAWQRICHCIWKYKACLYSCGQIYIRSHSSAWASASEFTANVRWEVGRARGKK